VHPNDHNQDRHPSALSLVLPDALATDALGAALARALPRDSGLVITLEGDLGAGKTSLVRAMLRTLGHTGPVKSPTYALVELYKLSSLCFYHFDFYRFNDPEEFVDAGLADYFRADAVCCVEWPDKAQGVLPAADLAVRFEIIASSAGNAGTADQVGTGSRRVILQSGTARGDECLARLPLPNSIQAGASSGGA
jgi:tRNA threonylcarbamoyladenosine biosynthesis protein TsaE